MFSSSRSTKRYRCKTAKPRAAGVSGVTARHSRIRGFSQAKLGRARVLAVGAGGIISWLACPLVRKGVGVLHICDGDVVELSNLSRQMFVASDLYKNKAQRLARNLRRQGFCGTQLVAHPYMFEELLASGAVPEADIIIVGVDDDATRLTVMEYCRAHRIRVILIAVSPDADNGYVFVYEPNAACLACVLPDMVISARDGRKPCPGVPACLDILLTVAGFAAYVVDTLLMERPRTWNFRRVFLSGEGQDLAWNVPRRPDCAVCGSDPCQGHEVPKNWRHKNG